MYNGRHCISKDLDHISALIKRFISFLDNNDKKVFSFAILLEKEIDNFDNDIAKRFSYIVEKQGGFADIKEKCLPLFDELISNIIVDIKEHNN